MSTLKPGAFGNHLRCNARRYLCPSECGEHVHPCNLTTWDSWRGTPGPLESSSQAFLSTISSVSCMAQSKFGTLILQAAEKLIYPIYKIPPLAKRVCWVHVLFTSCHLNTSPMMVDSCCIWGRREHDGQRRVLSLEHFEWNPHKKRPCFQIRNWHDNLVA